MIDDRVTVWLNGQLVVDNVGMENAWIRDTPLPARGPIELIGTGSRVSFRNISIRELPKTDR